MSKNVCWYSFDQTGKMNVVSISFTFFLSSYFLKYTNTVKCLVALRASSIVQG